MDCRKQTSIRYPDRQLIELNSHADMGIFEYILTLNSNHFTAFNPGKSAFLLCQGNSARKIDFHSVPEPNRSSHWNGNENPCFADVIASAVKKSIGFRQPDTYGPGKIGSSILALLN